MLSSALFTIPTPSNAFSVASVRVSKRGAISLRLRVPGPGTLTGTANFMRRGRRHRKLTNSVPVVYGSATVSATTAETLMLAITPTRAGLRLLRANNRLTVRLALAFTPTGGTVSQTNLRVSVGPITTSVLKPAKPGERVP
jgi:hypothetical protein